MTWPMTRPIPSYRAAPHVLAIQMLRLENSPALRPRRARDEE